MYVKVKNSVFLCEFKERDRDKEIKRSKSRSKIL